MNKEAKVRREEVEAYTFRPKYRIMVPAVDFTSYNLQRTDVSGSLAYH